MEPVQWGVIGTAKIATQKVIPGLKKSPSTHVRAIASRNLDKAPAEAEQLGIPQAYGSYEELLADTAIEAVYIPLPNHLHVPWTIRALEAGKHVLCEKPIALTANEAAQLVAAQARTGKRAVEAFMIRHHPQWLRVRELVQSGTIGEARAINCLFTYHNVDPANVRNQIDIGGGGLYDVGCYAVAGSRFIFGEDPVQVIATFDRDPVLKTDRMTSGMLCFPKGRQATFTCSTQLAPTQQFQVSGPTGRIAMRVPFNPEPDQPTRIVIDTGQDLNGSNAREEVQNAIDQYGLQGEAFSRAVRGRQEFAAPIEDAVMNMRVIDALFRSAESGRWERP